MVLMASWKPGGQEREKKGRRAVWQRHGLAYIRIARLPSLQTSICNWDGCWAPSLPVCISWENVQHWAIFVSTTPVLSPPFRVYVCLRLHFVVDPLLARSAIPILGNRPIHSLPSKVIVDRRVDPSALEGRVWATGSRNVDFVDAFWKFLCKGERPWSFRQCARRRRYARGRGRSILARESFCWQGSRAGQRNR